MMEFWSSMDKNYQELKATQQVNHWQDKYTECQKPWDRINGASKEFNRMIADFETEKWWLRAHCTGSLECDSAFYIQRLRKHSDFKTLNFCMVERDLVGDLEQLMGCYRRKPTCLHVMDKQFMVITKERDHCATIKRTVHHPNAVRSLVTSALLMRKVGKYAK